VHCDECACLSVDMYLTVCVDISGTRNMNHTSKSKIHQIFVCVLLMAVAQLHSFGRISYVAYFQKWMTHVMFQLHIVARNR